jgi:hypothetical protein
MLYRRGKRPLSQNSSGRRVSKAGLPVALVLYCAPHTFGTAAYGATGNLAMVMNVMGHSCVPPCGTSIRCWIRCGTPSIRGIYVTNHVTTS